MTQAHLVDQPAAIRLAAVVDSTRPGRKARVVTDWVLEVGRGHPAVTSGEASLQVLDLADVDLPLLDELIPAAFGAYQHGHTRRWAGIVAGFVFVTPEYNHSFPAALKNAIDFLFAEWAHKPAGFVSYGLAGGVRAVEQLRLVLGEVQAVPTGSQVALSVFDDFDYVDPTDPTSPAAITPREHQSANLLEVVEDCLTLCRALAGRRTPAAAR